MAAMLLPASSQRSEAECAAICTPDNRKWCGHLLRRFYLNEDLLGRVVWCYERNESQHLKGKKLTYHERVLERADVAVALLKLAAEHGLTHRAIELAYKDDKGLKEIGEDIGSTDRTVKRMLLDGLDYLIKELWVDE